MIENVDVQFGASAPGLGTQVREVIGNIHSVGDAMQAIMGFAEGLREGFREAFAAPGADRMAGDLREAATEANHLGDELDRVEKKGEQAGRGISNIAGGIKGLVAGFVAGLSIDAIMGWIDTMASGAERLGNLSQRLNISATNLSSWNAIVEAAGGSAEGFAGAMTKLEVNTAKAANGAKEQAGALKDLGISAQAARDPNEMLLQIADRFSTMDDGPKKVALAMALMGRSGAEQIPILNQGREAIEEQMRAAQQYGAVMDESMIARAQAVDAAMDETGMALKGVSNTIFDAAAPAITTLAEGFNTAVSAMMESYRAGGVVKTVMDIVGDIIKITIAIVVSLGWAFYAAIDAVNGACWWFDGVIKQAFASVQAAINVLIEYFKTLGQTIIDVLTFNWDDLVGNVRAGLNRIAGAVAEGRRSIAAAGAESYGNADTAFGRIGSSYNATDAWLKKFMSPGSGQPASPPASGPRGSGDFDLDMTSKSGGGGGGGGASRVQKWQEELQRQQQLSGEYFKDQNAAELAFWQGKLALTSQGSKDWYDVQAKIFTASRALAQQQYQEQISSLDFQIQGQRDNFAEQARLEQQKVDLVGRTYGLQSAQYNNALREQQRMAQQHQEALAQIEQRGLQQRLQMDQEAARTDLTLQQTALQQMGAAVQFSENAGLIGRRQAAAQRAAIAEQEFQARAALEDRLYRLTVESLRAQLQIEGLRAPQLAAINNEIEKQEAAHNQRMRVLTAQHAQIIQRSNMDAAEATRQVWLDRLQPVSSALTGMVNGFLTGTQTIRGAVLQMGSQILQNVNKWLIDWVTQHVAAEQAKTAATVAGDAARTASTTSAAAAGLAANTASATGAITTNAAVAGSGALAAVSSIPVIGPFIAPAIAAGILALAMGFISKIASAEGGWGQVPYDGAMTELHKDEMVLPASIASPLRDALQSKDSTWSLGETGRATRAVQTEQGEGQAPRLSNREGDTHIHISALDTRSGIKWLQQNRREIGSALRQTYREGNR